ncbi:hypothetical protein HYG81_19080 (plasmid) [Natrinema zhouii]|uniref:hypothetical protein n=1 Tax=Natrinema zhouii TaxID=1710539 RepID=UPI001E45D381|nr:hypothetical protein [Natrinema zhouii]UHQ98202.1 hypothetical protein HYG81_19080 [Natrinema zhouii]
MDLLEELDTEAEESGFSSRSEYIRHLLLNRPDIRQMATADDSSATTDSTRVEEIEQTIEELADHHDELTQRITDLEEEVEQLHLNADQPTDSSPPVSSTPNDSPTDHHPTPTEQPKESQLSAEEQRVLDNFKRWLDNNGPQSDDARTVLVDAAHLLGEQGPLGASELRRQLYDRHPDAYSSAEALWASTVERLYDDLPGFERPEYGMYMFDQEAPMESLADSPD